MPVERDQSGFYVLWPTLLVERVLPGYADANRELERLILANESENENLTTDYLSANFLALENPAVDWLRQCIHKTATDFCNRSGINYNIDWTLQGWANINRLGDYHDPHNHPYAYLSGTYYVRVPEDRAALKNRRDVRPGQISFYDPRGSINMTAIKDDPQIEAEFTIAPQPGTILLWPSFLMHFVHPNLSERMRISISFNLVIRKQHTYLPSQ